MWPNFICFWDVFRNVNSRHSRGHKVPKDAEIVDIRLLSASALSDLSHSLFYPLLAILHLLGRGSSTPGNSSEMYSFNLASPCFWPRTPASSPHLHLLIKPEDVPVKGDLALWGFACFHQVSWGLIQLKSGSSKLISTFRVVMLPQWSQAAVYFKHTINLNMLFSCRLKWAQAYINHFLLLPSTDMNSTRHNLCQKNVQKSSCWSLSSGGSYMVN